MTMETTQPAKPADILQVNDLKVHYPIRGGLLGLEKGAVRAVDGLSFTIGAGETLALVGESGCGKSTVGKAILGLQRPTGGQVILAGERIDDISAAAFKPKRRRMQVVFQDPFSSLNPRMRIRDILAEPIRNFGLASSDQDLEKRLFALLDKVKLPRDALSRKPHEFSGGQRQRVCIARALAVEPDLIICDEAVSALDVSVKAQIVNLLQDIQVETGLALLFISHDLAIVEHMAHRAAVMYLGRIVEIGKKDSIFTDAHHPYTQALLSAVPMPVVRGDGELSSSKRIVLSGDVPSPVNPPTGCHFHLRCPYAFARCSTEAPLLSTVGADHFAACHLNDQKALVIQDSHGNVEPLHAR